jgi:hypothetical protein
MKQPNLKYLQTVLIMVGLYAAGTFTHDVLKFFLLDSDFCDFAVFYSLSGLLGQGTNFLDISLAELQQLQANSGIPHICYSEPGVALYSPAFYFCVAPLTRLNFGTANILWFFLNTLALISSVFLLMRAFSIKTNTINLCVASFIVFTYQPLLENIALGQSNILILLFFVLAMRAMMSSRLSQAGIFIACAALIKPQYAFVSLFFPLKKLYKPFLLCISFYISVNLLSVAYVGWEFAVDFYFSGLVTASRHALDMAVWAKNLSLFSGLSKLLSGETIGFVRFLHLFLFLFALAFTVYLFRSKWRKNLFPLEFSWFLSLVLIFMPLLEEHYLVVLYLPIFLLLARMNDMTKKVQCVFIIGFLLVSLRYSLERFEFLQLGFFSIVTNGKLLGTILIMLALLLCQKKADADISINRSANAMLIQGADSTMAGLAF